MRALDALPWGVSTDNNWIFSWSRLPMRLLFETASLCSEMLGCVLRLLGWYNVK
jgi:hypothetical protein